MVSPVLAGENNPSLDRRDRDYFQGNRNEAKSDHMAQDQEKYKRCQPKTPDSFTGVDKLFFDQSLIESTPHWIFLASGEKEKTALLRYIDLSSVSRGKRNEWKQFLRQIWDKYPVRYEETASGARLVPGKSSRDYSLTNRENETFREIEQYIAEDMEGVKGGQIIVQFAGKTHAELMLNALTKENQRDSYYQKIAEDSAQAPDDWYINDPIPGQQQYNHGFVPVGILLDELPSLNPSRVISGIGTAPDNAAQYAQSSRKAFSERNYDDAFENMGYASHFISDLGNPYHTPNIHIIPLQFIDLPYSLVVFPNAQMLCDYKTLHDAYEDYANQHLTEFGDTDGSVDLSDPLQMAKIHGTLSWGMSYPLLYQCYWHFVFFRNLDFASNPGINFITRERITATAMMNRGLVRYVTAGKPITYTITPSMTSGGSVSPSSPVTIAYGQSQMFVVTPESGYRIRDVRVNGESQGAVPQFLFDMATVDKARGDQTIEAVFAPNNPTPQPSSEWIWARDGWDGWQHTASWSGDEMGPNSEYGPLMVEDHGVHGALTNLGKGEVEASVWRTFDDPTGTGWKMLTFKGVLTPSSRPEGRWMKIEVNGLPVFSATELNNPPGRLGEPFTIQASFPLTTSAKVTISHGQNPAWGPDFVMDYYSLTFDGEGDATLTAQNALFLPPQSDDTLSNTTENETGA